MILEEQKEIVWFESLPSTWKFKKLKFVVNLRSEKVIDATDEVYVGLENIESKTGKYLSASNQEEQDIEGISNKFHKGDVLFGKLRPYLAKCIESDFEGICTTELLVLDAIKDKLLSTYLKYLLLSPKYIDYVNSSTYGSKMPRANWEFIKNIEVPLPCILNQSNIIKFIEYKTVEIDGLINNKQNLVSLLEEMRQAKITEVVTKGLNPNVKMKDSGVEWIGEMPEHWKVRKIKNVADIYSSNVDKKSVVGELDVQLCNYVDIYYNDEITRDLNFMKATAKPEQIEKFTLQKNDVIITKDSESPIDIAIPSWVSENLEGIICGYHLALLRSDKSKLNGQFLYYSLESEVIREQFYSRANGVTRFGLGKDAIKNGIITCPPLIEQIEISKYLYKMNKQVKSMKIEVQNQILKLKEYRQSLIYEAVAGKIDVRDVDVEQ